MSNQFGSEVHDAVELARSVAKVGGIALAAAIGDEVRTMFVGSDAQHVPLTADSLFPVASVTTLATALAIARLVDQGLVHYDDELSAHVPDAVAALPGIGLRQVLSHSAGLPADLAPTAVPYAQGLDWSTLRDACLHTELATAPRTAVQYGNVGYGLAAIIVERSTELPFLEALRTLVLDPLGIEAYLGDELPRAPVQLADVRGRWAGTDLEPFNSPFWRSLALPWAGLVTNLDGAFALIRAWQGHPVGFLKPATLQDATANQVGDLGGGQGRPLLWSWCPWGLGPEIHGTKTPHWAPSTADRASFGHAGASGCLVWSDRRADVTWAMLGTRTADNGWVIRYGSQIGAALLRLAQPGNAIPTTEQEI